jgi:hypothetical protein
MASTRVIQIRELLDLILQDCPRRELSQFARTCWAVCPSALDRLWQSLPSLVPLIDTIPNNRLYKCKIIGGTTELVENFHLFASISYIMLTNFVAEITRCNGSRQKGNA